MDQIRNCHVFYPYYPKVINDSWDYSDFGLLKNKSALTTIADAEPTMRKRGSIFRTLSIGIGYQAQTVVRTQIDRDYNQ